MPSLDDLRYSIRRRARRVRYAVEDLAYATRRGARRASSGVGAGRSPLTLRSRNRLVGILAVLLSTVAVGLLVVPRLPCQVPGGDECQPDDEAAALVPGDAAAYAHADVDRDTEQYERASALAERLPLVSDQVIERLPGPRGASIDYTRDVAPWLGGEAALALIPVGGEEGEVTVLLEVGDEGGATRFVQRLAGRDPHTERYRAVELRRNEEVTVASVSGFVVVGPERAVKRVIDVHAGERALADSELARQARDELPEPRLAELYLSARGADELLAPSGPGASFESFVNARATAGMGAAVVADQDGLELDAHSVLDPEREKRSPGFFGALPPFEPALGGEVSDGALAYVALGDPADSIEGLLAQATAEAPAVASGFEDVGKRLRAARDVNLEDEILPLLTSQVAVSVEPSRASDGSAGVPYVSLIVDDVDEERAKRTLAGLPERGLQISPTVKLSYAVVDGKLVVSTAPPGVTRIGSDEPSLDGSERFAAATGGFPDELSALAYLNLGGLIGLAEQVGLGADPAYVRFSEEFRRLEALGVAVERHDEAIDTRMRLTVGE